LSDLATSFFAVNFQIPFSESFFSIDLFCMIEAASQIRC